MCEILQFFLTKLVDSSKRMIVNRAGMYRILLAHSLNLLNDSRIKLEISFFYPDLNLMIKLILDRSYYSID